MLGHRQTSTTLNRDTKWVLSLTSGQEFASALHALRSGRKPIEEFDGSPGGPARKLDGKFRPTYR
jgi:hypothetical protein